MENYRLIYRKLVLSIVGCILLILGVSCSLKHRKEPQLKAVAKIKLPPVTYQKQQTAEFSFEYSSHSRIEIVKNKSNDWFNIVYPKFNATVYCSFLKITRKSLNNSLSDSYNLAYSHVLKANSINQTLYTNLDHKTSGILYDIDGNVATPIQFYITDSTAHFLRGSLYYNTKTNDDSVAPITQFIRNDIIHLMESTTWK